MDGAASPTPGPLSPVVWLEARQAAALARLAHLRADFLAMVSASAGSNADDEHDPEGATVAYERSQLAALIAHAERQLVDIELARARLAAGRYGTCETCGDPIAPARLEARPMALTCVGCAASGR